MNAPSPSTAPSLFLIDGSALAYRSHFAFAKNPLVTRKGKLVSAIYGFTSALLRIIEHEAPTHLCIVFDSRGKTFRHEEYEEYKATREKMPEELVDQLPPLHDVLAALHIPVLVEPGVEADDVIGTLARRAQDEGFSVRIVSGDKDFLQLVDDQILLYGLGRGTGAGEIQGEDAVQEKFGVRPDQVIDLLALMGDSSDNVPGVPRVGQKTAAGLLQEFGSLEGVYENLADVKRPALRKSLTENRDLADLSQRLVTIRCDVPVAIEIADLERRAPDDEEVHRLFHELEFQSLLAKLPQSETAVQDTVETSYELIESDEAMTALLQRMRQAELVAIDTETTNLNPLKADLVGISVSTKTGHASYIPVQSGGGLFGGNAVNFDWRRHQKELAAILADPEIAKAGQNIKYDLHVLERAGLPLRGVSFDTMVAHYCLEPSAANHSLDALALEYFQHTKIKTTDLIGKGRNQITMAEVPVQSLCEYACEDADFTFRLVNVLREKMQERKVDELFDTLEMPLIEVLRSMEAQGIRLDAEKLTSMRDRFETRRQQLEKQIHELAGEPFNVSSPRQLGEVLYDKLELHKDVGMKRIPRTKTGYSTNAAALQKMEGQPIVDRVLEYRQLEKLLSTYVDALPRLIHPKTGKIHTSFNQTVAATGRLSSSDPNLQNIPIRTAMGRDIRRGFRSSFSGGTLISADYSQVELRILSHVSGDERLIEAFQQDQDVHRRTASLIFQEDEVSSEMRTRAKAINFGIIYGMGAQRLSRETGLTFAEAQAFIQRYFEVFSGVKKYLDRTLEGARENGYVTTLLGRRRYIPEIFSEDRRVQANAQNMAVNTPIQGTAADLIKRAMIAVHSAIESQSLRSRMVLQVHDELVFDVWPGESEAIHTIARDRMENAFQLAVPLRVDIGEGETWLDAH